jgi:hypothetical protein
MAGLLRIRLQHVETFAPRKIQVENHQIGYEAAFPLQGADRLFPIGIPDQPVPDVTVLERLFEQVNVTVR